MYAEERKVYVEVRWLIVLNTDGKFMILLVEIEPPAKLKYCLFELLNLLISVNYIIQV